MVGHESAASDEAITFGPFRLIAAQRRLLEAGQPVALGSRAMELLIALVRRAGDLVGKDELIAQVWPDTFVDESNLRVHLAALRRALRDGQDGGRYVVTIPGRGYRFVAPVTAAQAPPAAPASPPLPDPPGNLPFPPARIVGRAAVVGVLSALLRQRRFVTLVGPGGIGKTTVALAVAREAAASLRDGVGFIDLGPISDPSLLASTLATTLGLTIHADNPLPAVIAFLREKQMLLVFDSCEHVIEAAATTTEDVFNAAPGVHILATSREPLRASGERVHRLSPLEGPPATAGLTASDALEFPSVQLFVERAAASLDNFELSDVDAPVVADICRRLDGIALAIELAAGCVAALGLRALAAYLDDRFRLLMSGRRTALPRHQTLAATLEWSYQLLPETQRTLLRCLAVFAGDFPLEAAFAVAPDLPPPQVVDHVSELVAKSLLVADLRGVRAQYRLLDTTRLYGLEKLKSGNELAQAARRHAAYYRAFFARAEAQGDALSKPEWLAVFGSQLDNLRAALEWAFSADGDAATGVALTIAALPLWVELSLLAECRGWAERALASLEADAATARARMQLTAALGWSRMFAGGPTSEAGAAWAATLALSEELGDPDYKARALWGLWVQRLNNGALDRALETARDFERIVAGSDKAIDRMMADRMLGTTLHFMGDQPRARECIERLLAGYVAPGRWAQLTRFQFDQRVTGRYFQARILWLQGFADQATRAAERAIAEATALDHALLLASALGQGGCPIALFTGDLDAAEQYATTLLDHADKHGLRPWHLWARCFLGLLTVKRGDVDSGLRTLRLELDGAGEARFLPRYLLLLGELAASLGQAGEVALGLQTVEEALARCEHTGEGWYIAELLRIKGELLLSGGAAGAAAVAEDHCLRALDLAQRQGAPAWQLRAAISLARLRRDQGRSAEARTQLSECLARFSEGFGTADLRAANYLLGELDGG